jgi:aspartate carbamoyltransferase catalytic subunit
MHPGQINRGVELDDYAADGPQSVIGEQVENGIFVRMAALNWVFSDPKPKAGKSTNKAGANA